MITTRGAKMNSLQQTVHLVATDEAFRAALLADSQAALAEHGLVLSAEEMEILGHLRDGLVLPAESLAERFQQVYLTRPCWDR
ncbi:MAG: hypothetical protein D6791_14790 [Chloroflexi bacterium]|nr:MAG: hypothetical protein D6791_14790 [Chloroflexota bacterium]